MTDMVKPTEEEMASHEMEKAFARSRVSDGKYVVFKIEDFYQFCTQLWDKAFKQENTVIEDVAEPFIVPDATVLRDQDILTAPALNSYADAALTVHDILEGHSPQAFLDSLHKRAEFFRARAMRAQLATNRRLPD